MKKLLYFLFTLNFKICRIFPVRKNRVTFLAPHRGGGHDSLAAVSSYIEKLGGYKTDFVSSSPSGIAAKIKFLLFAPAKLARSKYIFLNDNFMPMASLNFSPEAVITQLWHGEGAFKKFGLMTDLDEEIRQREEKIGKKLTWVICTSENVRKIYAEAFGADISKVVALGSPRVDRLLSCENREEILEKFYALYPETRGRKLVLYAPTFRDNPQDDGAILNHIDGKKFEEELGNEYALLVKLHPQVNSGEKAPFTIDVTGLDISDLTLICDVLVTDYSSVCMDFALLGKPCVFYAYDLEKYRDERSFCFGYEDYVPGDIVGDFDGVISAIKNPRSAGKTERFRDFNYDYTDCFNTKRVADFVLKGERG